MGVPHATAVSGSHRRAARIHRARGRQRLDAGRPTSAVRTGRVAKATPVLRPPVPRAAAPADVEGVCRRLQRGQGDRLAQQQRPQHRPDAGRAVLGRRQRDRDDGEPDAVRRELGWRHGRRARPPVRPHVRERRRHGDRHVARQGALPALAADHRDPRGRLGRQPGDGGRPGLDVIDRVAALPRPPVRALGPRLLDRRFAAVRLRHRRGGLHRHQRRCPPRAATRASRRCATRSWRRGSGPGSTSASRTRRPSRPGAGSPTSATGTRSDRQRPLRIEPSLMPARQRAVDPPAAVAQAAGAERVGHRGRRRAHEQRRLEREREVLDRSPRLPLRRRRPARRASPAASRGGRRGARRRRAPARTRPGRPAARRARAPSRAARRAPSRCPSPPRCR